MKTQQQQHPCNGSVGDHACHLGEAEDHVYYSISVIDAGNSDDDNDDTNASTGWTHMTTMPMKHIMVTHPHRVNER